MKYEIEFYYTSHRGKCRKMNQDNLFCAGQFLESENNGTEGILKGKGKPSKTSVFAVFDGMGGEERGEMAAYIATEMLKEYSFEKKIEEELFSFCKEANTEICRYAKENEIDSMGTTAAILAFSRKKVGLCNIGDSKIYLLSEGKLQQISKDHVTIAPYGTKPPLTQNLGIPETELLIEPYTATGEYHAGDVYLISSDGLTDMVEEEDIKQILENEAGDRAAERLLKQALEKGGRDNITFILLYVKKKKIFKR